MKTAARVILGASLCAALPGLALAQPSFMTIAPDVGYDYAVVQDVSRNGRFVLVSLQNSIPRDPLFGYILDLQTGTRTNIADTDFGRDLNALSISSDGTFVVGYLGGGPLANVSACVWTSETGVVDIGGLPGGNVSYATGVSGDGAVVVGTTGANFGDPYQEAWRWTQAEGFTPLGDLGPDTLQFGSAEDVSADGMTVVGTGSIGDIDPDTDDHAYAVIWPNSGAAPTNIGNLPSPISTGGALATAASADGSVVVGFSPGYTAGGVFANRGFRWTPGTGMVDIGPLPARPNGSIYISDCSSDGNTLVGYMIDGGPTTWQSVVWTPSTGVRSLRTILGDAGVSVPANLGLRETFTGGDGRVIAGWAYNNTTQRYVGYVAQLGAVPCVGDFNRDGGVDGADVQAFFEAWEAGLAAGDVNEDGGVDGADVAYFFGFWEAGC